MQPLAWYASSFIVALAGFAPPANAASDLVFVANFEPPPDCAMPGTASCPGFTLQTPDVQIDAGQSIAYCYYFHMPTTGTLGVGRFSSVFGADVQHIIVYVTTSDHLPPGTLSSSDCGLAAAGASNPRRVYQAHHTRESLRMPSDDGSGMPVAVELAANQPAFAEMYFANADVVPVTTSVTFSANGLAGAQSYTKTATYMLYNGNINVPSNSSGTATDSCAVPGGVKFWWFSTHTHRFATEAKLSNGATALVDTTNFEDPAIATYSAAPFYVFGSGDQLTYSCSYLNNTASTLTAGDSYDVDENCVGIGYFFPATGPLLCVNHTGPF